MTIYIIQFCFDRYDRGDSIQGIWDDGYFTDKTAAKAKAAELNEKPHFPNFVAKHTSYWVEELEEFK